MSASSEEPGVLAKVLAAIRAWLPNLRRAVFGAGQPDPSGVELAQPAWADLVDSQIMPALETVVDHGWTWQSGEPFVSTNSFTQAQLAITRNLLVRMPDDVYNLIFSQISEGVALGESNQQISDRIDRVLFSTRSEWWENRAKVIARTECLPGDAIVDSANIVAAYRRWYEGQWIEIETELGVKFSGTPNHPMLTKRGWIGLGQLNEGDHLIGHRVEIQYPGLAADPDIEAKPTTIAQVFDSLAAVGFSGRMGAGQPDFHGDGLDGYVDVLVPSCALRHNSFNPVSQESLEGILEGPDLAEVVLAVKCAPFGQSPSASELGRLAPVPGGLSGRLYDAKNCVSATSEHCCHNVSGHSAEIGSQDFTPGEIAQISGMLGSPMSARFCGLPAVSHDSSSLDEAMDTPERVAEMSSDSRDANSGKIHLDKVVRIRRLEFSGHVYNLTTEDGYFLCNGLYTSNTNRAWNAGVLASAQYYEPPQGRGWVKVWNADLDGHERPAHRRADGQTRGLSDTFQVGGFDLRFPGDPAGPADQVVNCRCEMTIKKGV